MKQGHGRLIQDVLNAIAETDTDDDVQRLPDERLLTVLAGRWPLTPQERRLLARSAATRERLVWLRNLQRARALAAWQAPALRPQPLQLLAAADETPAVGPLRLVGEHFSIALTPVDRAGRAWHIAVQIAPALIEVTPGGFQLLDSEGLIWLTGHPDVGGELTGYWQRDDPLWERVHRVRLELAPR